VSKAIAMMSIIVEEEWLLYFQYVKKLSTLMIWMAISIPLSDCSKPDNAFTICGTQCPSSSPWTVESLDMGLPCFKTQDTCERWAQTHGYSDKPCVQCD
jgi:hypothetical protein